jgi:hypothetical protein
MLTATFGYMHCSFDLCRYGKRRWLPHKKSAFAGGRAPVELPFIFETRDGFTVKLMKLKL